MGTLVTDNIFGLGNTNPIKGSLFFEGKSSYLDMASGEIISGTGFGTNDFTIEFWINQGVNASNYTILLSLFSSTNTDRFEVAFHSSTIQVYTDTGAWRDTGYAPVSGQWEHIAFVRNYSGNTLKMYANGVEKWSVSNNHDYNEVYVTEIGSYGESSYGYFEGYLSNFRIVNGTALYTTNYFTPPTEELTVVDGTVLLCCQDSNDPTQEATGKTITPYGNLMVPVDKPELVTNGDFSNELIGWDEVSVGTGYVRYDTSRKAAQVTRVDGSNSGRIAQGMGLEVGKVYDVRVRCHSDSNTGLQFRGYKSSDSSLSSTVYTRVLGTYGTTVFHFRYTGESGYDGLWFLPIDNTSTNSYITNISVKEYDPRPGDNLILNGNADSGKTNEWTTDGTFTVDSNRFKIANDTTAYRSASQSVTVAIGSQYKVSVDCIAGTSNNSNFHVGNTSTSNAYASAATSPVIVTPTTTTLRVTLNVGSNTSGHTAYYDNIVVTPVHNYNSPKNVPTISALADDGVVFVGDTKFDTKRYMVPPTGTTEQRGRGRGLFFGGYAPSPNALRNIIDYVQIQSQGNAIDFGDLLAINNGESGACSSSTRALYGGGQSNLVDITYVTIATTSNATDFGDLLTGRRSLTAVSNSTRGLFAGGTTPTMKNEIEYVTIASIGNATDFGDLTVGRRNMAPNSSPTRGVFAGGNPGSGPLLDDTIDYVTIASAGNAIDFGNMTQALREIAGSSSSTRGLIAGGYVSPANINNIEYITIATTGNATDFGDLHTAVSGLSGTSNGTRGVFAGGSYINNIQYVTIATTGNASDFGDLTAPRMLYDGTSDSHGGIS